MFSVFVFTFLFFIINLFLFFCVILSVCRGLTTYDFIVDEQKRQRDKSARTSRLPLTHLNETDRGDRNDYNVDRRRDIDSIEDGIECDNDQNNDDNDDNCNNDDNNNNNDDNNRDSY